ncbi:1-acyl-sn-glycerol-3-phosphate acyltransferase [Ulvibacter antarcticus]|uniref:1-acyl-sn-glycerol-3-phosphate acyltransferase n=1 Tax=Ulvibacter antarcticus TaxID=442714 RepID=A0A3L9YYQ6_9FLAO|nr:1-acyl-sn-glycerol-3-phosphate acyltransferase [Ulvibacter antarcticus]RMA64199.1 1-acyl-sn-glycerol-3-phosphate acyltransferase [Ulvibacter antarcticus]
MYITKFFYEKILGWKVQGDFDRSIKKSLLIVAPHTSYFDFILCILVRRFLKIQINFVGKKELFKFPIGWYFRWMGGEPLDRAKNQNKVEAIANVYSKHSEFRLAISPEGTRKKVERWRTGYYYIALNADVPIIPIGLDYTTKTMFIGKEFYLSGDIEKDEPQLKQFFKGVVGKVPEWS